MQYDIRSRNHHPCALLKSSKGIPLPVSTFDIGSLVHIKHEGNKFKAREQYIVISTQGEEAILQKLNGSKFMSKKYVVPFEHLMHISQPPQVPSPTPKHAHGLVSDLSSESDPDDTRPNATSVNPSSTQPHATPTIPPTNVDDNQTGQHSPALQRSSSRERKEPDRYGEWGR